MPATDTALFDAFAYSVPRLKVDESPIDNSPRGKHSSYSNVGLVCTIDMEPPIYKQFVVSLLMEARLFRLIINACF